MPSSTFDPTRPKASARESGAQAPPKRHAPVEAAESDQDEEIARLSDQLRRREQRIVDLEVLKREPEMTLTWMGCPCRVLPAVQVLMRPQRV